jgi:preprotein translocase subunit SecE
MSKKRKSAKRKSAARVANTSRTDAAAGAAKTKALKPAAKKSPAKSKKQSASPKMGGGPMVWWQKTAQFFREVKVELKKVTWPSRKETLTSTSVVVALVLLASIFLGIVDLGLSRLIRTVIG